MINFDALFQPGYVVSFSAGTYTAVIELVASRMVRMIDVPVNRGIAGADMVAGRRVLVWMPADGVIESACVVAVWA